MSAAPVSSSSALDALLSYRLGLAGRLLRAWADDALAPLGVGGPALGLLVRLAEENGLAQADLARRGRVEASTVCRMVDRLVRDGLVERRSDPADRRTVRVHLTARGREVAERGMAVARDLDARMAGGLDEAERAQLSELLGRVLAEIPGPVEP
jgi:MarR family transcriptional regulator for hemolysin